MLGSNGFEVQIAHSVEEIGQAAWDHPGGGRPFASYRGSFYHQHRETPRWG